jgi:hypothetical protein
MRYLRTIAMFIVVIFLLSVVGCVSDEANRYYLQETLPAKKTSEVEVLKTAPTKPYIVVADFQAVNASPEYMRKRAAEIGADAVIIVPVGGWYSRNEVWAGKDRHSDSYSRLLGTAIKYKTE